MKLGDEVEWISSGTDKTGMIILEVAPWESQESAKARLLATTGDVYNVNPLGGGQPRDEVSYFVAVRGAIRSKPKVYHPRVSALTVI